MAIINLFQLVTPYEEPTSSDSHHIMERKNHTNILSMNSYSLYIYKYIPFSRASARSKFELVSLNLISLMVIAPPTQ